MRSARRTLLRAVALSCTTIALLAATVPTQSSAADTASAPSSAATTQSSTIRFKHFSLKDDQGLKDMEVFRGIMPADWDVKGGAIWKPNLATPQLFRIHWSDAQDVRSFDLYPSVSFSYSQAVATGRMRIGAGQVFAGFIVQPVPADVFAAFDTAIIKLFRTDLAQATAVTKEKLPAVAKQIYDQLNTDPNTAYEVAAGRETFEYSLNGQTIEESLTGVMEASSAKVNNPNGVQYWTVALASSRRAPKGTLNQLAPVEAVMAQSLQINPDWLQKVNAINQQRYQQSLAAQRQQAANQQAWFNSTEHRIAAQSAANDAQHASYWAHSSDLARQSENEADVQREVSPWQSPDGSTYKLPTTYSQAWQGSDGQILMNNDASYNPNSDSSLPSGTTWTAMQPTHN